MIWEYYLEGLGGLIYDFEKNNITTAKGDRVDLSIVFFYPTIADEVISLVFKLNSITFHVGFSEETREHADLYHGSISRLERQKDDLVKQLAPRFLTQEAEEEIASLYLQLQPLLSV
jgi:hypothetical protein